MLSMEEWHDIFHIGDHRLLHTSRVVDGMKIEGDFKSKCSSLCEVCIDAVWERGEVQEKSWKIKQVEANRVAKDPKG